MSRKKKVEDVTPAVNEEPNVEVVAPEPTPEPTPTIVRDDKGWKLLKDGTEFKLYDMLNRLIGVYADETHAVKQFEGMVRHIRRS